MSAANKSKSEPKSYSSLEFRVRLEILMFRRVELPPWVEAFSRAVQTSIVLFWGRWGLPVPFRTPLLYAIGAPLDGHLYQGGAGEDNEAQVDVLHAQFCDALVKLFDSHKADYGWAHKTLRVV